MKSLLCQIMSSFCRLLRNHIHFVLVVGVLLVIMTWPTIVYVFNTDVFWLPTVGRDVWMRFWDAWYTTRVVVGSSAAHWTETLFYPIGISLDYHPFKIFHAVLLSLFGSVVPASNALNIIYLLIIVATTASTYLYLLALLYDKWVSLFGAVIVGFSQFIVGHAQHPDLNMLVTLPLSLLALHRAVFLRSWTWTTISGIILGVTAFVGMYMFVCVMLTVGVAITWYASSHLRDRKFWLQVALLLCLATMITVPRIYPMIRDSARFNFALDKTGGKEDAHDLLASFVNYHHPVMSPMFYGVFGIDELINPMTGKRKANGWSFTSYLGYLPLLLVALGLVKSRRRRNLLPWLLLFLCFFSLRLGSFLRVNDVKFVDIHLPKHYFDELLPPVFQAFNVTEHFMVGLLLPLAILSCYGMRVVLKSIPPRYHTLVIIFSIAIVAFEYYQVPRSMKFAGNEFAFNGWLLGESKSEQIRLVNLPMGRHQSKIYGFYQSLNSFPHAEGLAMRTPLDAYNYIRQNELLATWQNNWNITCNADNSNKYLSAAQDLLDQGFSHIVHHVHEYRADRIADSLSHLTPAYRDEYVAIYRMQALHYACADKIARFQDTLPHLKALMDSPAVTPRPNELLMNVMPVDASNNEAERYFNLMLTGWRDLVHVIHDAQGNLTVSSAIEAYDDLTHITAANNSIWLIYNPQHSVPDADSRFGSWLRRHFRQCQQFQQAEDSAIEHYIDRDYPCDLVLEDDPFQLSYDNGILLSNVLRILSPNRLDLYFWWTNPMIGGYAYSVQLFNIDGEKVKQVDHVIGFEPLTQDSIDISTLATGEYVAMLILYEHDSGKSQSGIVLPNQLPFQRELEIASFAVSE